MDTDFSKYVVIISSPSMTLPGVSYQSMIDKMYGTIGGRDRLWCSVVSDCEEIDTGSYWGNFMRIRANEVSNRITNRNNTKVVACSSRRRGRPCKKARK